MRQRSSLGWIGLLGGLLVGGVTFAQTENIHPAISGSSSTLQIYQQGQQMLAQEWQTLVSQGATQQQLEIWRQQNAAQFQAQQQLSQTLAMASALQPMPATGQASIPANASGTLKGFLTTRANLANARAQIHNQLLQALPSGASPEQINAMQHQVAQIFQQQYARDLQLQGQRAQTLAAESASKPVPVPGPPVIPPNASPQLQAFLNARYALASERAHLRNQYVTADPQTRQAALRHWQQQNAGRFEQLSQLAQGLSNSAANNQEINNQ